MSEYEKQILSFCEELELNINNPKMDFEKKLKLIKSIRSFVENSIPYEDELENQNITLKKENTKLKQALEKIKELPHCDICDANWHKGCLCLQNKIKEVLENDR